MGDAPRFEEVSPWVEEPADRCEPLDTDLRADVVVIGAGYTGLSSAIALRAEGADVVVLEQDFAGAGASGRNAGHLTPTIGKDLPTLLRVFGREKAGALVRFADRAVEFTEELIEKQRIDCEYVATGNILAGLHPKHDASLQRAALAAAELGGHLLFLSPGEMRERGLPHAFRSGVLEGRGGHLHPGRFVMGLRRAALDAGVRLFEDTRVLELSDGDPAAFRRIEGAFRERFPTLQHVPVAHFWGGWIGLTPDFLPIFGTAGAHRNLHYGLGFAGHGVAQATLMGAMLASRIQGRAHSCEAALTRRGFDWPPEPLRWIAAKLVNAALSAMDARTDRQIRQLHG